MAYIVDQLFPPIQNDEEYIEYSSFNYWRDPVFDIPELDLNLSDTAAAVAATVAVVAGGNGNAEQPSSGRTTPNSNSSTHILNKALPTIPENIKV